MERELEGLFKITLRREFVGVIQSIYKTYETAGLELLLTEHEFILKVLKIYKDYRPFPDIPVVRNSIMEEYLEVLHQLSPDLC